MGYLDSIIQDARRHGVPGSAVPMPQEEAFLPETSGAEAEFSTAAPANSNSPAAVRHHGGGGKAPEPLVARVTPIHGQEPPDTSEPTLSSPLRRRVLVGRHSLSCQQVQEGVDQTEVKFAGSPQAALSRGEAPPAVDLAQVTPGELLPLSQGTESSPLGPTIQSLPRSVEKKLAPITGQSSSVSGPSEDKTQNKGIPSVVSGAITERGPGSDLIADRGPGWRMETTKMAITPPSESERNENDLADGGVSPPSADRHQPQWLAEAKEATRIWPQQETAVAATTSAKVAAEPRVHIGRIEVVILAPEPAARPSPPRVSLTEGLVSRQYLRRL